MAPVVGEPKAEFPNPPLFALDPNPPPLPPNDALDPNAPPLADLPKPDMEPPLSFEAAKEPNPEVMEEGLLPPKGLVVAAAVVAVLVVVVVPPLDDPKVVLTAVEDPNVGALLLNPDGFPNPLADEPNGD